MQNGLQRVQRKSKATVLTLCAVLLVSMTGCQQAANKPETTFKELRMLYQTMIGLQATAEITADYGERFYTYRVTMEGDVSNGSMTVQAPENVAGMVLQWKDGKSALSYQEVTLDMGELTDSGLSPADAMPVVLGACRGGLLLECAEETTEQETVLFAKMENPNQKNIAVSCWLRTEDGVLKRAELSENGRRVISMDFLSFELEFDSIKGEKSD